MKKRKRTAPEPTEEPKLPIRLSQNSDVGASEQDEAIPDPPAVPEDDKPKYEKRNGGWIMDTVDTLQYSDSAYRRFSSGARVVYSSSSTPE